MLVFVCRIPGHFCFFSVFVLSRDQILRVKGDDTIPMILVGNKVDLADRQRRVNEQEARSLAESWKIPYIETSAKSNLNVDEAFKYLLQVVHKRKKESANASENLLNKNKKKKRRCSIL